MPRLKTQFCLAVLIHVFVALTGGVWKGQASAAVGIEALRQRLASRPQSKVSSTRQFIVIGHEPGSELGPLSRSNIRRDHIQMEPGLVAMISEKIKSEFLFLFRRQNDAWESQITLHINGKANADTPINVAANYSNRGWRFDVSLPGQVEKRRLVRAVVRVLLLDVANRGNRSGRVAEVPLWMQEGLAAYLYGISGPVMVPNIGTRLFGLHGPTIVPLQLAPAFEQDYQRLLGPERQHLELFAALSFTDLQHPMPGHLQGYPWQTFQACSHVFVSELLKLRDGRELLWKTIKMLPHFRNGQMSFMEAFKHKFPSILAADKWWAVALVDFKSRGDGNRWSEPRTLRLLDEILHVSALVRKGTNTVPTMKEMMFQDLVRETTFERHRPVLVQSIHKLVVMQVNSRRDLARLIHDYRDAIEHYLRQRESQGGIGAVKLHKKNIVKKLDLLDGIRFDFALVASPEPERPFDLSRVERLLQLAEAKPSKELETDPRMELSPVERLLEGERKRLDAEHRKFELVLIEERQRVESEDGRNLSTIERMLVQECKRLEEERRKIELLEIEFMEKKLLGLR